MKFFGKRIVCNRCVINQILLFIFVVSIKQYLRSHGLPIKYAFYRQYL